MRYYVKIDVRPIVYKLWGEYNGDLSQKKWLNKESKNIQRIVQSLLTSDNTSEAVYNLNKNEKELTITFEWKEKENIHVWVNETKSIIRELTHIAWTKNLNAWHNIA
jgi:type I site-specific restriction-modification system R (restriction) subunit